MLITTCESQSAQTGRPKRWPALNHFFAKDMRRRLLRPKRKSDDSIQFFPAKLRRHALRFLSPVANFLRITWFLPHLESGILSRTIWQPCHRTRPDCRLVTTPPGNL